MLRKGWQKIMRAMKARHSRQQKNCAHSAGPHSSLPSTKGFLWGSGERRKGQRYEEKGKNIDSNKWRCVDGSRDGLSVRIYPHPTHHTANITQQHNKHSKLTRRT